MTTISDAQGQFAFENLYPGMHQIEALQPSGAVT
jgi:hypothetical protein